MPTGKSPITHLPVPSNPSTPTHTIPSPGDGSAPRTGVPTPIGAKTITVGGLPVVINLSVHSSQNIVDLVNGAGLGAIASIDRFGRLVIATSASIAGDLQTLVALGLA
jgi:hypothetical protein